MISDAQMGNKPGAQNSKFAPDRQLRYYLSNRTENYSARDN